MTSPAHLATTAFFIFALLLTLWALTGSARRAALWFRQRDRL